MKDLLIHNIIRLIFILIFHISFFSSNSIAQDNNYSWNDLVAWNGVTHWTKYLIISPDYFGPNALPIPELKSAILEEKTFFESNLYSHFSPGDKTTNAYLRYYKPFNKKIAIEISMVPIEYYQISASTRDKRKIRNESPTGFAAGDIMFGTIIQLIRDHSVIPDITYGMYFRTTSGGKLDDARFTDMPGYNFDITFGKNIKQQAHNNTILRWYASLGFYVWQTNLDDYLQNDAISGGVGFSYKHLDFEIENVISGYYGYISNKNETVVSLSEKPYKYQGDQPLIYKLTLSKTLSNIQYSFGFQQGLHDYNYSSFMFGIKYYPVH